MSVQLPTLNCKKMVLLFLVVNVLVVVALFGTRSDSIFSKLSPQSAKSFGDSILRFFPGLSARQNKNILIWNSPGRIETAAFGLGHEPFVQNGCEIQECVIFDNVSSLPLEEYDAIIMHMHELWLTTLPNFTRPEYQRLIFLTQESPASMPLDVTKLNNTFNWIMSYRMNSDVRLLYGRIEPGPTAPKTLKEAQNLIDGTRLPTAKNYAKNKTRPVAWMVSRCNTHNLRETYVRQLSKFIPVDIYGGCGNLTCNRNGSHWLSYPECYDMLEQQYKFYLSFENSICTDYVTEKFFQIMDHNIVPVVYGGANYSQIAPPHSYINALDFTPAQLADYLKMLDANDMLYNEYFWWKGHYRVEAGVGQMARHGFCDLCKKLHQDEGISKLYQDLVPQWHADTQCYRFVSWETNP